MATTIPTKLIQLRNNEDGFAAVVLFSVFMALLETYNGSTVAGRWKTGAGMLNHVTATGTKPASNPMTYFFKPWT